MKFRNDHWEKLRQAIKGHGVWDLVSTSGEELVKKVSGAPVLENFDPLMAAHNMIVGNALEAGGLYLLGSNPASESGQYCPLCEVVKHTGLKTADEWIAAASQAAADEAANLSK